MGKAVTALQAAHRGSTERKQFKQIREQVSAALIMNSTPSVVRWPSQQANVSLGKEERLPGIEEEEDI